MIFALFAITDGQLTIAVGAICGLLGAGLGAVAPWRNAGLAALNAALDRQDKELADQRKEIGELRVQMAACEAERTSDRVQFAAELMRVRQELAAKD